MAFDQMTCTVCGATHSIYSRTCGNCGYGGVLNFRLPEPEQWAKLKTEIYPKRGIPLPPQIRQEVVREEEESVKTESVSVPSVQQIEETCLQCGREFGHRSGVAFSFCAHCGADSIFPRQTVQRRAIVSTRHKAGARTVLGRLGREIVLQTVEAFVVSPKRGSRLLALGSFFLPGIGQLLNGQLTKALQIMVVFTFAMLLFGLSPFGLLMLTGRSLIALDAFRIAERRRVGRVIPEWDFKI